MSFNRCILKLTAALLFCGVLATPTACDAQLPGTKGSGEGDGEYMASATAAVNFDVKQPVERLQMVVKGSRILTLNKPLPKFQVTNEEVLVVTPFTATQVQVHGLAPGNSQVNLWDAEGKQYTIDVIVMGDAREVEGILGMQLPMASLKVLPLGEDSAIISGNVTSVDDVDRAVAIVEQFYPNNVVNNIRVVGVQQVLLHTKIMEVSRTKLRSFGIDWGLRNAGSIDGIVSGPVALVDTPLSPLTGPITAAANQANTRMAFRAGSYNFESLIKALRQNDLIKVLAEPTVVATHGRPSRFIVGGRVPYLVPSPQGVTVAYEEFGTSVDFLPFVVGPGRVRLEVRPEVSEPDQSIGLTLQGTQVPGFRSRYVETAVELQAGQTFAIAGLLQTRVEAQTRAVPLLGELPYFGTLFRSVEENRNEIELLILVTPELVDAMEPHEVPAGGPGLNSVSPTDKELYCKGYIESPVPAAGYPGDGCSEGMMTDSGPMAMPQGGAMIDSSSPPLPPNAVVPAPQGTEVAPGITIMSPEQGP